MVNRLNIFWIQLIRKLFKIDSVFWGLIIFIIFITSLKLKFLELTPFFGDEALYCYLGHKLAFEPFFRALNTAVNYWKDAPGLLFMNAISFKVFGQSEPIINCRSVSVVSSGISQVIFYLICRKLIKQKDMHITAAVFFILNPYNLFFDRTNLMDASLVLFILMFIYFSVLYLEKGKIIWLLLTTGAFFYMFLTKYNSLLILPAVYILFLTEKYNFFHKRIYIKVILTTSFLLIITTFLYTRTWETVFYHISEAGNILFTLTRVFKNIKMQINWYIQFLTPLSLLLFIYGSITALKQKKLKQVLIVPYFILIYALLSRNIFPRYLLMTLPFFAVIIGYTVKNFIAKLALILLAVIFIRNDLLIIFNPESASLAGQTKYEFYEDWGSGIGTEKTIKYLLQNQNNLPDFLLIPSDLEGLFFMMKLKYIPESSVKLIVYHNKIELDNVLNQLGKSNIYVANSQFHQEIFKYLAGNINWTKIYDSNGYERNSILLFKIN